MGELWSGAEDLGTRRGGGPDVVDWNSAGEQTCGRGRVDVIVFRVEDDAGGCTGQVEPGRVGGDRGRQSEWCGRVIMEGHRMNILVAEMSEKRGERITELTAGTVASEDDMGRVNWSMKRSRWWRGQIEVCGEDVEESAWKWILRGQAVAEGEDAATGFTGQLSCDLAMADLKRISWVKRM